ncbi:MULTISPECIES: o-succinylbenzoate--CoA ligase [unclassified Gordonia (in: high G+C Gram-positive bacteria)]|uniref:o-succinylbenzoate--CoA ligase n=1 Tax=unclassified Gordonia (in: high G+C Gram-positive bacteria) TaxID=2657482 RepID=UPI000A9ED0EA|nr:MULTISPECIES: o-succinylbenzoate--CoA ligase [unclassified Gordonia (in: high G+C Gram-positive bacteria)]
MTRILRPLPLPADATVLDLRDELLALVELPSPPASLVEPQPLVELVETTPPPVEPQPLVELNPLVELVETTPAALPVPTADPAHAKRLADALAADTPIDDAISLVISTSGTTGTPKGAQHTPHTLAASAAATHNYLGGQGNWLLALAPHHIAGLQVLLRALAAGFTPGVLDVSSGFDPDAFADALDALDGPRRYTSLVPTQLIKVLDSPRATAALRTADALLVGGAATPAPLLRRALDAGLPIVRTYGMSETGGGCVYDGIPLDGVTITLINPNPEGVGRVVLSGPMVAHGYRNLPDHPAFTLTPGARTFITDDLGRLDDGVLSIIGRADEAITTGGLTVVPQVVEAVILDDDSVRECAVVGLPDDRLGEKVVAFVIPSDTSRFDAERIRGAVVERLDRYAAPRDIIEVDELPLRGPGKIDRRALRARFS